MRRLVSALLPAVLAASVLTVSPAAAAGGGPSVPLPGTSSTPVSEQKMGGRDQDQATGQALHGNQSPGGSTADGGGTSKATPLSPSAKWDVSAQTGDFSWSYPLRVPPAPGGLTPQLGLGYASSAVDGRTSATNNQASWVGDGWSLEPGFIERSYRPCADDTDGIKPPKDVGDLCWRSDNAIASYSGGGGELVKDDNGGGWRSRTDDGSRVERLGGAQNDDNDGEHWRITAVDGTQYLFGSRPESRSTWTVPVFGDDVDEPCHGDTFAESKCVQAWRWNLDKVIDRNGNVIVYNYQTETNNYGLNNKDTAVPYVRGGWLDNVEYGLREGTAQHATGRVEFRTEGRCVPGSECTEDKPENWPDVSWKDKCAGPTCDAEHRGPSFWTTKRLAEITAKVWNGSAFSDAEKWQLEHQFPKTGDAEKPALWLRSIKHIGLAGTPAELPPVTFEGTKFPNRVNEVDGIGPLIRYRITAVVSETGGVTTVKYRKPDCADGQLPANPESNTKLCFPQWYSKKDQSQRMDYFHKYVVEEITQSDRISSNTEQVSSYDYVGGAAWAYDTSEFTKDDKRTYNEFRGFTDVRVKQGKTDDPSGPVTMVEKYFYRGMHGDRLPSGTREATVTDSEGGERLDESWLRGQEYETQVHDGTSDRIAEKTISTPVVQGPTAVRGNIKAYIVRPGVVAGFTALATGSWRKTRTERSYDDRGLPVHTSDLGDLAVDTDDRCTHTTYARNTTKWLLNAVSRSETLAVACTENPQFPRDAIADTITAFDGKAFGQAPDRGNPTRVETLDQHPAADPVRTLQSVWTYDVHGRVTSTADALGQTTTTKYVPETGGPVTQVISTNALGYTQTTTLEPFYGQETLSVDPNKRRTETVYDALGRKTEVWLPNRPRRSNTTGNAQFAYTYRNDGPTVVTSRKLGPSGDFITSKEIYDGLLRVRQAQVPASGGGRLIVDTRYDSQGRGYKTTMPYFNDAPVDEKLLEASDTDVASYTVSEFDGVGRETAKITKVGVAEKWRTSTKYDGDRVHVTPPQGGTPTTTISDAQGRKTEFLQYQGTLLTSLFDTTKYTYTRAGQPETVTDPGGGVWRETYDLRGRKIRDESPDKGVTTTTYDELDRLRTTTDALGVTLTYSYDKLNRKKNLAAGAVTLAEWTYDTAPGGIGLAASSTRYVGGATYKSETTEYNALNLPLGAKLTIPATEQTLAGTYESSSMYNVDGSTASFTYAKAGSLPVESAQFTYDALGKAATTSAGYDGRTDDLVTATDHTRYGEVQRTQLGTPGKQVWLSRYYDTGTRRLDRTIVDAELPNAMQSDVNYTYNPAGIVTSIADKLAGQVDTQCFRYDHLQRLTEAWTPGGPCTENPGTLAGPAPYRRTFTYDKSGNRATETQYAPGGNTERKATFADGTHRLASLETKTPSGTKTDTFGYDAAGNTKTRPNQQLDWDAEGHLAKATEAGKVTEFVYDAGGTRLLRRDPGATTLYLDGQELKLVKATGKLEATRYYQHGGDVVAMRDNGGTITWLANDHQSTAEIAIRSGDLGVTRRRQLPFGEPRGGAVAFPGEKGFVGGTIDASTGLTHLGAREYDPALGRFISVDPVRDSGDPQQLNGYTYSNNSPLSKMDPTGMRWGVPDWASEPFDKALEFTAQVFEGLPGAVWEKTKDFGAWAWENKSWIGVGLGVAGLAVTAPVAGTVLFVSGVVVGAVDTVDSLIKGDFFQAGLGVIGLVTGGVGRALGKVGSKLGDKLFGVTGVSGGTTGAVVGGKQPYKPVPPVPAPEAPAAPPPPPPYVVPTDWGCHALAPDGQIAAGAVRCNTLDSIRLESGYCKTNVLVCLTQPTGAPPVNLGTKPNGKKSATYYQNGKETGPTRGRDAVVEFPDGRFGQADGKGRTWS